MHQAVARDFRNDRRARDRVARVVAADDRGVLDAERPDRLAVDEHVVRPLGEAGERAPHGEHRRVIDVEAVDLAYGGGADAEIQTARSRILIASLSRSARRERFESSTPRMARSPGGMMHGARDNGAREGAPSHFIDTGDQRTGRLAADHVRSASTDRVPVARRPTRACRFLEQRCAFSFRGFASPCR